MIERLERELGADAALKVFCDERLPEANTKKDEESIETARLSTRLDRMAARSAQPMRRWPPCGLGSGALMQPASCMSSARHSRDPFAKPRGLISEMIERLEQERGADATLEVYCDRGLPEANRKKEEEST